MKRTNLSVPYLAMDPGAWGYAPAGATSEDAAVVVSARDAKRLKEKLDAAGWLDRTRRPVTHPADDETGRPAAVAFPVCAGSLEGVREMARGDAGALAVCDAALPDVATPVDQRAAARASGGGSNDIAGADRGVLPAPPALDPNAPPLWPPPVPEAPARRDVARVRCPATAEAFAEVARAARGEPLVLTDVPMGNATSAWTPERFATCAEADQLVDVHVCPPDASTSREARDTSRESDPGIPGTPTVDLAGHRAPGTRRNFQFRAMPLAEFAARVVASGTPHEERRGRPSARSYPPIVAEGETYYLRSVADAKKARTHVARSFPSLASDLRPGALLPPLEDDNVNDADRDPNKRDGVCEDAGGDLDRTEDRTLYPRRAYHSSVLRVASRNVALWTHYDTHDNVLAQIAGRKTVTLWPPDAEPFMHCEGSSSRVADVAAELDTDPRLSERRRRRDAAHPRFAAVSGARRVAALRPGEALYIPALWFHHAHATSADEGVFPGESQSSESSDAWNGASVAVNVFWRCLPRAADHDPGDVFGNRDPPAARRAAELAAKAGASLASLPEPQRRFYARRAAKRLAEQLGYALDLSPT